VFTPVLFTIENSAEWLASLDTPAIVSNIFYGRKFAPDKDGMEVPDRLAPSGFLVERKDAIEPGWWGRIKRPGEVCLPRQPSVQSMYRV
jgi:hypothetical protein